MFSALTDLEYALTLEGNGDDAATESDLLLAQMLQLQFDKEHDALLDVEERKQNANSKGRVLKTLDTIGNYSKWLLTFNLTW